MTETRITYRFAQMVSKTGATVGRFLLALVFIASGIGKVAEFNPQTGGPSAEIMVST